MIRQQSLVRALAASARRQAGVPDRPAGCLSAEQVAAFHRDGYLVVPGDASPESVAALRAEASRLLSDADIDEVSVFSTEKQVSDEYFLGSGDKIRFFFEADAFRDDGQLKQARELSINKIGHALHEQNPEFQRFSYSDRVRSLASSLGFRVPLPVQSMYICKQPRIGGKVVPHQDSTFLYTEPSSCIGLWWALQDATEENGCLWAIPGSHHTVQPNGQPGPLQRFVRNPDGPGTIFVPEDKPEDWAPERGFVPVPVKSGDLVLIHGNVIHKSEDNHSELSRHAYSIHVIEGGSGVEYPPDNWLSHPDPVVPLYSSED